MKYVISFPRGRPGRVPRGRPGPPVPRDSRFQGMTRASLLVVRTLVMFRVTRVTRVVTMRFPKFRYLRYSGMLPMFWKGQRMRKAIYGAKQVGSMMKKSISWYRSLPYILEM